jgi:hypothetical protein
MVETVLIKDHVLTLRTIFVNSAIDLFLHSILVNNIDTIKILILTDLFFRIKKNRIRKNKNNQKLKFSVKI